MTISSHGKRALAPSISALALFCFWPTAAIAGPEATNVSDDARALQAPTVADDASAGDFAPQVAIEAGGEETNASISFRFGLSRGEGPVRDDSAMIHTTSATLAASAPVNGGDGSSLFDFARIADGTTLTFGLSHYWGRLRFSDPLEEGSAAQLQDRAVRACIVGRVSAVTIEDGGNPTRVATLAAWNAAFGAALQLPSATAGGALTLIPQRYRDNAPLLAMHARIAPGCTPNQAGGTSSVVFVREHLGNAAADTFAAARPLAGLTFIGIKGSVARDSREFLDTASFALDSVSRTAFGGTAYVGYLDGGGRWSGRLSIEYQRKYEDAAERTLCRATMAGTQECLTGADGRPLRLSRVLASAEGRARFTLAGVQMAVAPRVDYDFDSDEALLSMPIYMLRSGENRLTSGIRIGYGTERDEVEARLFVGIPFSSIF